MTAGFPINLGLSVFFMSKKQRKEVIKMYVKHCPECGEKSYSSGKKCEWNCLYCDHDLSEEEAQIPKKY